MRRTFFLATLWLIAAAAPAFTSPPAGTLNGIVLDAKDAPVASARVFWQAADGSRPHTLRTDGSGHFRVARLRAELYDLRAQAGGTWSEWEHNVLVRPGADTSVTLRLVRTTPPSTRTPAAGSAEGTHTPAR
jgi:hypothetical protein